MSYALSPNRKLMDGATMPVLGLGALPLRGAESTAQVRTAIQPGSRLIDIAENYENDEGVRAGIMTSGVGRSEIFLTTSTCLRTLLPDLAIHTRAPPS